MSKRFDLTGRRFGALVALQSVGNIVRHDRGSAHRGSRLWRCKCDCGAEVVARSDKLTIGKKVVCNVGGHSAWTLRPDPLWKIHATTYNSWMSMRKRCGDRSGKHRALYYERGIRVCARWSGRGGFANFLADMGPRPSPQHSIDRFPDGRGNYKPGNCRWATALEQRLNSRDIVYVTYEGERMLLVDLVAKLGVRRGIVYARLKTGWALDDALAVPVRPKRKNRPKTLDLP